MDLLNNFLKNKLDEILGLYIEYSLIIIGFTSSILSVIFYIFIRKHSFFISFIIIFCILFVIGFINNEVIKILHSKSFTDALTGLNNRMYFYYKMPYYLKKIKNEKSFLFAMIDIDHFKSVNDEDGHNAGDILIKEVADILKNTFNKNSEVIRYGGDEFCIILPDTDINEGYRIFENLRMIIYNKYNNNNNDSYVYKYNHKYNYYITISVGLININEYINIDRLVENADKCLYKAKENRNKVVVL